ncbi:MAG: undecaprenyl-diphosphate phosphatase [Lautropia sp.]|nr:undecaprenyl-diphosphate phosphatase [Lautropia sp.]
MSDLLPAIFLGIIEGLTEFLPISSTGHLLIAQHWLPRQSDFFNIVVQAGAILAITLVFRQRIWSIITGFNEPQNRDYAIKIVAAFMVTALVGLPVRKMGWELPETVTPIAWALIIGGVWMLLAEHFAEKKGTNNTNITWTVVVLVGLAQVVAGVFPGTSRSAAAIFMAMLAGVTNRTAAAEFVFLVGIPTMFAASGYTFLELVMEGNVANEAWGSVAVAFIAATLTGFIVVRWLMGFIKKYRYTGFAIYRMLLGAALLLWLPGQ